MVWPGIKLASRAFHTQPHPDDVPGQLLRIRAMTSKGQALEARLAYLPENISVPDLHPLPAL